MIARRIGNLGLLVALAACSWAGGSAKTYNRSITDVRAALLATPLPFPLQGTSFDRVKARQFDDGSVGLVLVNGDGSTLLEFRADVVDTGNGMTRVAVRYEDAGAPDSAIAKRMSDHPEIRALFLKTMSEQVDAELEGRPFNNLAIGPEMSVAFAANAQSFIKDVRAQAEADQRHDRANIDKAYADAARGK
jgi:hypothetical protein